MFLQVRRQIVVSHPAIYPVVSIVGRPGARLPYVKIFGLHYQILPDKIVLTYMPGVEWNYSNEELTDRIANHLVRLAAIIAKYNKGSKNTKL